jgi:hypothetical protein
MYGTSIAYYYYVLAVNGFKVLILANLRKGDAIIISIDNPFIKLKVMRGY